jgi:DNA (cytosine-5)-methyltransferase 1
MEYKAVSLFSGAGGMDIGFQLAGVEAIWANDFDPDACESYRRNLSPVIVQGDVKEQYENIRQYKGVDFVFGGPPCQGFSVAGKMDPKDERSSLIWSFAKSVEIVQPRVFVMENVKALALLKRWESVRQALAEWADRIGYSAQLILLDSSSYSVPQKRERMFLFGFRTSSTIPDLTILAKKFQTKPVMVREILKSLGPAGGDGNKRICRAKVTLAEKPVLRRSPYAGMLFNGQGRPVNPNSFSATLPATMGGNRTPIVDENQVFSGAKGWVEEYHSHLMSGGGPWPKDSVPGYVRRLTVDEAQRIQTFPDEYEFYGRQSSVFRQIGNAVPCKLALVAAMIARSALETIDKTDRNVFWRI